MTQRGMANVLKAQDENMNLPETSVHLSKDGLLKFFLRLRAGLKMNYAMPLSHG